jgi:hypothetical protein
MCVKFTANLKENYGKFQWKNHPNKNRVINFRKYKKCRAFQKKCHTHKKQYPILTIFYSFWNDQTD